MIKRTSPSTPSAGSKRNQRAESDWIPLAALLLLFVVALSRSPYIFFEGRFWAEEGSVYFAHLYREGISGLGFVYERTGYFSLFINLTAFLATLVPLAWAPLVTTWLSLLVILWMLWLALVWPSRLFPNDQRSTLHVRIVAAVLLLVGTASHPEVWANSVNAQTHWGVIVFLFAMAPTDQLSLRRRYVLAIGATFAVLSSPYAVALVPMFMYKAYQSRTKYDIKVLIGLFSFSLVQAGIAIASRSSGELSDSKLTLPSLGEAAGQVASFHVGQLVLGYGRSGTNFGLLAAGSKGVMVALFVITMAVVAGLVLVGLDSADRRTMYMAFTGWLGTLGLVLVGGHGSVAGGRYAVTSVSILLLMFCFGLVSAVRLPDQAKATIGAGLCAGVLGAAMFAGLGDFWTFQRAQILSCTACPSWAEQTESLAETPDTTLSIWPYPRWEMKLTES